MNGTSGHLSAIDAFFSDKFQFGYFQLPKIGMKKNFPNLQS